VSGLLVEVGEDQGKGLVREEEDRDVPVLRLHRARRGQGCGGGAVLIRRWPRAEREG